MALKEKHRDKIAETFANPEKITLALTKGVHDALLRHKQAGNSIVVWRDGKIVWLKPEKIPVQT
jgi:hypothetical protein